MIDLQSRHRKKMNTRKRLVRNYFNNHHWKRAKVKPCNMMYASESDLPKWKSSLRMDFSPFISQNFDPVKQFKSIKALNEFPYDFKSHKRNLGIRQHALIAALKLSRCYGPHVQHDKIIFEFDSLYTTGPFISQVVLTACLLLLILVYHYQSHQVGRILFKIFQYLMSLN